MHIKLKLKKPFSVSISIWWQCEFCYVAMKNIANIIGDVYSDTFGQCISRSGLRSGQIFSSARNWFSSW